MQFYDEVKINIQSGRGGDGLSSGRREAGVPFGGPNGGDGGKGGDLIFVADKNENTLLPYRYKKVFKAKNGEAGRTKDQYGANGESTILKVPVGTLIKNEDGEILGQLTKDGEKWIALKGGEGGKGNIHFKDAVNQYPNFALMGEPGHSKDIILELQLLADVALIGSPSVGKSSLINSVSHTKAKVANYPFTTLIPNLGSVSVGDYHFNMIDIPGIIKGASEGKGLGNAFLRHILKARAFCFVADLSRFDEGINEIPELFGEIITYIKEKIDKNVKILMFEEKNYIFLHVKKGDELIMDKKITFAMNKQDLINDEEIVGEYKKQFLKNLNKFLKKELNLELNKKTYEKNCFILSAATHFGLDNWKKYLMSLLKNTQAKEIEIIKDEDQEFKEWEVKMITDITQKEKENLIEKGYIEEINSKYSKVWEINNPEICKLVVITHRGNDEAEMWFWKSMEHKGFLAEFEKEGIRKGDVLKIKSYYESEDDRYILY
ncbi:MAG TPA: GTPase ObgE [Candidatus Absconditabacterales bacterium]|nr:GTPase ObgE [Candidatus Absconditabacterales bacterium]